MQDSITTHRFLSATTLASPGLTPAVRPQVDTTSCPLPMAVHFQTKPTLLVVMYVLQASGAMLAKALLICRGKFGAQRHGPQAQMSISSASGGKMVRRVHTRGRGTASRPRPMTEERI